VVVGSLGCVCGSDRLDEDHALGLRFKRSAGTRSMDIGSRLSVSFAEDATTEDTTSEATTSADTSSEDGALSDCTLSDCTLCDFTLCDFTECVPPRADLPFCANMGGGTENQRPHQSWGSRAAVDEL
jgi:hypothetical protein